MYVYYTTGSHGYNNLRRRAEEGDVVDVSQQHHLPLELQLRDRTGVLHGLLLTVVHCLH